MMNDGQSQYLIKYRYYSTKKDIGVKTRIWKIDANSFGDAEMKFDAMFNLVNDIAKDVYGDDAVYEIICIDRVNESEDSLETK